MMITFNGTARKVHAGTTLDALVEGPHGIAIAVNGAVVPAPAWASTRLADGDTVDVVTAFQGG